MRILIVTIHLKTRPYTELFLKSLSEASMNFNWCDCVVVDNGSNDNIKEITDKYPFVKLITNPENMGVSYAWNQGIRSGFKMDEPQYDYYLICNNDIYWEKYSINNLKDCLRVSNTSDYGWISLMMNDYKEMDKTGIQEIPQLENLYWSMRPDPNDDLSVENLEEIITKAYAPWKDITNFSSMIESRYGSGIREMHPKAPAFVLNRECLRRVGLFEEYNSPVGLHEDADYCERIKRYSDLKIGCCYSSYIHHFSMMTRTKDEFKNDWVEKREIAHTEKWSMPSKAMHTLHDDYGFKLDIGSGERPKEGPNWLHMDIDPKFPHLEFIHDCSKPLPFPDDFLEEIYCSNNLEHIEWRKVPEVLEDWVRCLKSEGTMEIRVPNFKFAVERYMEGSWHLRYDNGPLNLMHLLMGGDQEGPQHVHKALFDYDRLYFLMAQAGLTNIEDVSEPGSWELRMIGEKI